MKMEGEEERTRMEGDWEADCLGQAIPDSDWTARAEQRNRIDREFGREAIAFQSGGCKVGTRRKREAGIEPATAVAIHIVSNSF